MVTRVPVPVEGRVPDGRTNAYVAGGVLVDPATRTDRLDAAVARNDPDHVAVTHTHVDHVGAVAEYADGRTVWARAGHEGRFRDATGVDPDRTFREGTVVGDLHVLDGPGHAPDGVAFEADSGTLVGDLAVATGSVVVAAPEGNMRAYLTSLRRLHARNPPKLYPGHGPVVENPRETLERLIDHRRDRERTIRRAVEGGAETIEEVVAVAYEKDLTGLEDLAAATVRAHLEKLAVEGKVEWDGERAKPGEE